MYFLVFLGDLFYEEASLHIPMYSDNGTTFVGANKYIKELYQLINDEQSQIAISNFMRTNEIIWNFISPHVPHFGSL